MNKVYSIFTLFLLLCVLSIYTVFIFDKTIPLSGVVKVYRGTGVDEFILSLNKFVRLGFLERVFVYCYFRNGVYYGNYSFTSGMKLIDYLYLVKQRKSDLCRFTFIPGKTMYYYKKILSKDDNFYGVISDNFNDGDILPDTYSYRCQSSRNLVLNYAKNAMNRCIESLNKAINYDNFYLKNIKDVVILASIVEMEAGNVGEMPFIASVFKNRLKLGMRLQSDPTVIYQQSGGTGVLGRKILSEDLKSDGVYNTYTRGGIPFAPISNPSMYAMLSVVDPQETDYLYFVADGVGMHRFAKSYKEHLYNVSLYRNFQIK